MTTDYIPFHMGSMGDEEINEVADTIRSGWLTTGSRTAQFETEFAKYVDAPHALAVNSCTAGLHLALHALGVGPGDEVITTPLTFCATVNVILQVGATPILADVDKLGNLDPASVRELITSKTRAIIPVHYAGTPCKMRELWALARRHGLFVIEDAAHATGTHYRGRHVGAADSDTGAASDAVVFSFYATKSLSTGEGGMVTTHHRDLYDRMRLLCLHGISRDAWNRYSEKGKWSYEVVDCGFKYNLSDIQSAVGLHQLRKQERFVSRRAEIARLYSSLFAGTDELETPYETEHTRHAWHLYVVRLRMEDAVRARAELIEGLREAGIGTSVHFVPIPAHPYYKQFDWADARRVPRAMDICSRIVSLPIYPDLTDDCVRRIATTARELAISFRQRSYAVTV